MNEEHGIAAAPEEKECALLLAARPSQRALIKPSPKDEGGDGDRRRPGSVGGGVCPLAGCIRTRGTDRHQQGDQVLLAGVALKGGGGEVRRAEEEGLGCVNGQSTCQPHLPVQSFVAPSDSPHNGSPFPGPPSPPCSTHQFPPRGLCPGLQPLPPVLSRHDSASLEQPCIKALRGGWDRQGWAAF